MKFEPVIGLEVHVQLNTNSKMFCGCSANYQSREPNTIVCPICLGLPGSLPSLNLEAVKSAIKLGLALDCKIAELTKFDRKNYNYPDLMKGYQISQYDMPIATNGKIKVIDQESKIEKNVTINRVHMEEDVAKLTHDYLSDSVFMDVNRSGVPLLEVVTEPDFSTAKQAESYLVQLQSIVRYLKIGSANMEEGSFRCDANVSIRKPGTSILNEKVEIKNMNRIKAVTRAIQYEIKRQSKLMINNQRVIQETRGWNDLKSISISQRSKEEAHDYRYFPEPDIPALKISKNFIKQIQTHLPELPQSKKNRFMKEYNLSEYDSKILVTNQTKANLFEKLLNFIDKKVEPGDVANWMNVDINKISNANKDQDLDLMKLTPENFATLIILVKTGTINKNSAKELLEELYFTDGNPKKISEDRELLKIQDSREITKIVSEALNSNPDAVQDYLKGKETAVRFLIGQVMKLTKGKADPRTSEDEIIKQLSFQK